MLKSRLFIYWPFCGWSRRSGAFWIRTASARTAAASQAGLPVVKYCAQPSRVDGIPYTFPPVDHLATSQFAMHRAAKEKHRTDLGKEMMWLRQLVVASEETSILVSLSCASTNSALIASIRRADFAMSWSANGHYQTK
jgi:hypothetical protein